jgi:hypothetical protein
MKFVSILLACLAAIVLAAEETKECEGERTSSQQQDGKQQFA